MDLMNLREELDNYVADQFAIEGDDYWQRKERIDIKISSMNNAQLMDVLCAVMITLGEP